MTGLVLVGYQAFLRFQILDVGIYVSCLLLLYFASRKVELSIEIG